MSAILYAVLNLVAVASFVFVVAVQMNDSNDRSSAAALLVVAAVTFGLGQLLVPA